MDFGGNGSKFHQNLLKCGWRIVYKIAVPFFILQDQSESGMATKVKQKKNGALIKEETSGFSPAQVKKFLEEVKVEFTKIVWPDRKVTLTLTGVVVILSLIIAAYLGSVDMILGKLISTFLK